MKRFGLFISLCMLVLLTSCENWFTDNDDLIYLSVSTPFISESDESTEITRSGSEASASQTVTVPAGNGMSLEATLERSPQTVTRATTSLDTGVKYRVIAFKQDDVSTSGYLSYADFTVGTSGSTGGYLHVPSGSTYTFVCYSLGTTTLPAFSESSLNISANPATDDLLYTKFNQSITDSNKTLSFSFKHQFSQVTVIADATAMGKNITAISSSLSPNYSGTLNLSTGTLTAGTEAARSIPWGTITAGQTVTAGACPVFTNGSSSVTVNISSVTIDTKSRTNLTATFGSNTMQPGYRYTLRLKFLKGIGVFLAGVTWAPGNLIKSGTTYTFAATQEYYSYTWNGGDYWNWGVLDPNAYTSIDYLYGYNYDSTVDPCQKVLPLGTWRMPSQDELTALNNAGYIFTPKNGVAGRFFGTTTAPVAGAEDDYVFLPATGYRTNGGTTMYTATTQGGYWSATPIGTTNAYGYMFYVMAPNGYFNGHRTYGLSIRCVK